MQYPEYVAKIIDKLESRGFEAYIVGGGVRDSLIYLYTSTQIVLNPVEGKSSFPKSWASISFHLTALG